MDKMQTVIMNYNKSKELSSKKKINKKVQKNPISTYPNIPLKNSKKRTKKIFEFRKIKRQKDMIMTNKVRKGNVDFSHEFDIKFNIYQEKSKRKSSLINEQLKKQSNTIVDKLKQRRDKSITKSFNKSFFGKKRISGKSQVVQKNIYNSDKKKNIENNNRFGDYIKNKKNRKLEESEIIDNTTNRVKKKKKKFEISEISDNSNSNSNMGKSGILEELKRLEKNKGEIKIDESLGINFDVSFEDKKIKSGLI